MKKMFQTLKTAFGLLARDIWAGKIVILILLISIHITKMLFGAMCPVVLFTGLPCPGCGMTRASISILSLQFVRAFIFNPSIYVWIVYVLYLAYYRYIKRTKIKRFVPVSVIVFGITIGIYLYKMIFIFPGEAPMTYMYDNFLSRVSPGYREFLNNFWKI